jgi:hypothetical protein
VGEVFPLTLTLSLQGREKREIMDNVQGREMVCPFLRGKLSGLAVLFKDIVADNFKGGFNQLRLDRFGDIILSVIH